MDIRGLLLDGFGEQCIDEADDWRIIVTFQKVFRLIEGPGYITNQTDIAVQ